MYSGEILDLLDLMADSVKKVRERFRRIDKPEDLVSTPDGITLLDAITMRLQVIGESVKRISKIDPDFFDEYPEIEWDKIARFRDLVSHHYEHIDYEIVYDICRHHITRLEKVLQKIISSARAKGQIAPK